MLAKQSRNLFFPHNHATSRALLTFYICSPNILPLFPLYYSPHSEVLTLSFFQVLSIHPFLPFFPPLHSSFPLVLCIALYIFCIDLSINSLHFYHSSSHKFFLTLPHFLHPSFPLYAFSLPLVLAPVYSHPQIILISSLHPSFSSLSLPLYSSPPSFPPASLLPPIPLY